MGKNSMHRENCHIIFLVKPLKLLGIIDDDKNKGDGRTTFCCDGCNNVGNGKNCNNLPKGLTGKLF